MISPGSSRRRMLLFALGIAATSLGAGPSDVVRVRVPASKIDAWFPKGTELISVPIRDFDALVARSRAAEKEDSTGEARLLQAVHRARWEDGVLVGGTAFRVRRSTKAAASLPLSPWNVAIEAPEGLDFQVRSTDAGAPFLWLTPQGPGDVTVRWRKVARTSSNGHGFALELPRVPISILELDLPDGLVPERFVDVSASAGDLPSGRKIWRLADASGAVEVRLRRDDGRQGPSQDRPWISGPTTIDVGKASASFRADWTVEPNGHLLPLTIEFSPALEPIDVTGPAIESTRSTREGGQIRVVVRFREGVEARTTILIRGLAPVPSDVPWTIPSIRPIDGIWIGGQAVVRLDRSRALQSCRVIQGRRIATRPGPSSETATLVFEPRGPGPVAELTLQTESPLRTAEVHGTVRASRSGVALTADLRWTFPPGRPGEVSFELPEGWSIGSVARGSESLSWHKETTVDGWTRIAVVAAPTDEEATDYAFRVEATRTSIPGDEPFELPRLRPAGVPAWDETWIALADEDHVFTPVDASGLAWVDPANLAAPIGLPPAEPSLLARAMAWRWTADRAHLRAAIVVQPREIRCQIEARVVATSGHRRIDWRLAVQPGTRPLAHLPVFWTHRSGANVSWRLGEETGPSRTLKSRPLLASERAELGFPAEGGAAFSSNLPEDRSVPFVLVGQLDQPQSEGDVLPLLVLPDSFHPDASVAIRAGDDLLTKVDGRGLRELEGRRSEREPADLDRPPATRLDQSFLYGGPDPSLSLTTELSRHAPTGLIYSAMLRTARSASGSSIHRLELDVMPDATGSLRFSMQSRCSIERASVDGTSRPIVSDAGRLSLPLETRRDRSSSRVVLEYHEAMPKEPDDRGGYRPTLPDFEMPCLRFTWNLDPGGDWSCVGVGPGLIPAAPISTAGSYSGLLRGSLLERLPSLSGRGDESTRGVAAVVSRRALDLADIPGITLGAWLLEMSRASAPIVVDRVSLEGARIGPDSRISVDKPTLLDKPDRVDVGPLCLVPAGGALIVTTRSSAIFADLSSRGGRASLDGPVRLAIASGTDPSCRWLALETWYRERSPSDAAPIDRPADLRTITFQCNGWPGEDAFVRIVRASDGPILASWLAVGGICVGVASGFLNRRGRGVLIGLATAAAIVVASRSWGLSGWIPLGALLGAGSAWIVPLARKERPEGSDSGRGESSRRGRGRSIGSTVGLVGPTMLALILISTGALSGREQARAADTLLVLLPYDGPPSPDSNPTRALLRLVDYERLRDRGLPRKAAPGARAFSLKASHEVELDGSAGARIVSEFAIVVDGDDPVDWRLPSTGAWDITATLDDRPSVARIEEGGRSTLVPIAGGGPHLLKFSRRVRVAEVGPILRIDTPINPSLRAVVSVKSSPRFSGLNIEGTAVRSEPGRSMEIGEIGPRDGLEISLRSPAAATTPGQANLIGLLLWDARPAGDLVRARLRPVGAESIAEMRLRFEPNVLVRADGANRLVQARWEGPAEAPEWVATFDPPCTREAPITLELWRPLAANGIGEAAGRRLAPRITAEGVASFSGVIALRRPGDWTGRISGEFGFDALDEESFVKDWGPLPDEPYTLAGVRAFKTIASAEVSTQPAPLDRDIRCDVRIELGQGRIDSSIEAALTDRSGRSTELDVEIPPDLVIERAGADGLASLSRPSPGRLHFELLPIEASTRMITIRGRQVVASDRIDREARQFRARAPLPRWPGIREEPGTLAVVSRARPTFLPATASVSATQVGQRDGVTAKGASVVYRVDRPRDLDAIQWQATAPRVAVYIQSRLEASEGSVDWKASVRYDISGGPLDVLYLKLPSAWAEDARIELVGDTLQRIGESDGEWTTWTLRPQRPIWGAARLLIRSTRRGLLGQPFAFPDLIPLGQGSVDKVLSVERRTDAPIELEGSLGLQPIDARRVIDGIDERSRGEIVGAYRVTGDRWAMTVRVGDGNAAEPTRTGPPSVREMETTCVVGTEGSACGRTTFLVDARGGSMLEFRLAPPSTVLWASSDRERVPVLSRGEGSWSIPLVGARMQEVVVLWKSSATVADDGSNPIEIPRVDQNQVPSYLSIHADPEKTIRADPRVYEPISDSTWRVERAERLARRILDSITGFDRSSRPHEDRLVDQLLDYELADRMAGRSADQTDRRPEVTSTAFREQSLARLGRTRQVVLESLELSGLDDLRPRLAAEDDPIAVGGPNLMKRPPSRTTPGFCPAGRPSYFRSTLGGTGQDEGIRRESRKSTLNDRWGRVLWPIIAIAAFFATPPLLRSKGLRSRPVTIGLSLLLVGAIPIAPIPGLVFLAAALIGRSC